MSRRSESGAAGRGKPAPAAESDQDGRTNKRSRDGLGQLSRQDERKPRASMIDGGDRISGSWRDGHGEGARGKSHGGGAAAGRKTSSAFQDRLSSSQGGGGSKASKMKKALELLKEVDQDEELPEGLAETAEALACADVMNHPDRDVRLLVACCLVEVLRIYAPDAPYTEDQILATFSHIITELRGLCTAVKPGEARTDLTYHLLDQLAKCKSCVILALLTNEGVPGGLEQLVEMFEVLLTGVRPEHDESLVELILETLKLCVEELDVIHQPLLDTVLIQLLPVTKVENPTSYRLATALLKEKFERTQMPISHFVTSILSGAPGGATESELTEHVLPLVYELHKITPTMLTFILPELTEQLKAEDVQMRSGACALLGRLFASKYADFGVEKAPIWTTFLGRFIDADSKIRCTMVEAGAFILQRKPALRKELQAAIGLRLQDPDAEVRCTAVKKLVELVNADPTVLPKSLLEAVGHRIKDRKEDIRQYSCIGMAKAYSTHISRAWLPPDEYQYGVGGKKATARNKGKGKGRKNPISLKLPSKELSSKLSWIPGSVVKAMGFSQDWELRAKVLTLLDEIIIPRDLRDEARAAGLAVLRHEMDMPARQGLTWILQDKRKAREEVLRFLDARDAHKAKPRDEALRAKVEARLSALGAFHPSQRGKLTDLRDLNGRADKKIFRLLRTVCSDGASSGTVAAARAELLARTGTKTTLGIFLKSLATRCCVLAVGAGGFQEICLACRSGMGKGDEALYLPPLGLLETLAGIFPEQARGQRDQLATVFQAAQEAGLQDEMSRVLAIVAATRQTNDTAGDGSTREGKGEDQEQEMPDGFLEALVDLCTKKGSTPALAAVAVRALSSLASNRESEAGEAAGYAALEALQGASKTALTLSPSSGAVAATSLSALATFAREFPEEFQRYRGKALAFSVARISGTGDGAEDALSDGGGGGSGGGGGGGKGRGKKGEKAAAAAAAKVISPRCLTFRASVELTGNCLMSQGSGPGLSSPGAAAAAAAGAAVGGSEDEEALLKAVFGLLEAEGQPAGEPEMGSESRVELRLSGSTSLVRLCASSGRMLLSPQRWHSLAWTLMDPSPRVRAGFLREICRSLDQTGGVGSGGGGGGVGGAAAGGGAGGSLQAGGPSTLRFMAYLCLSAFEVEPLRREAKLAMAKKVRQLRLQHEHATAAAATAAAAAGTPSTASSGDGEATPTRSGMRRASAGGGAGAGAAPEASMPEYVVPYAIHLLAHHPDFPVNKDDKLRMKNLQRYLEFLLDPLVGGHGGEADNLSLLLQMLDTITTSYEDALEPSSTRVHVTARVARQILASRIRTQGNLQPYPGAIFLPAPLFKRRARSSPAPGASSPTPFSPLLSSAGDVGGGSGGGGGGGSGGGSSSSSSRGPRGANGGASGGGGGEGGSSSVSSSRKVRDQHSTPASSAGTPRLSSARSGGRRSLRKEAEEEQEQEGEGQGEQQMSAASARAGSTTLSRGAPSGHRRSLRSRSPVALFDGGGNGESDGPASPSLSPIRATTTPQPEEKRQARGGRRGGGVRGAGERGPAGGASASKAKGRAAAAGGSGLGAGAVASGSPPQWGSPVGGGGSSSGSGGRSLRAGSLRLSTPPSQDTTSAASPAASAFSASASETSAAAAAAASPRVSSSGRGAVARGGAKNPPPASPMEGRGGRAARAERGRPQAAAAPASTLAPPPSQQQKGGRKRANRSVTTAAAAPAATVTAGGAKRGQSTGRRRNAAASASGGSGSGSGSGGGPSGASVEEEGEDSPSPAKKQKRASRGRAAPRRSEAAVSPDDAASAFEVGSDADDSDAGVESSSRGRASGPAARKKNGSRKAPLAAKEQRQQQQRQPAAGTPERRRSAAKRNAATAAAAAPAAKPATSRGRKAPKERAAASPKKTGTSPRQARAQRRSRGADSHSEEEEGVASTGKGEAEEDGDSDDDALMALSRRRRAAMQE